MITLSMRERVRRVETSASESMSWRLTRRLLVRMRVSSLGRESDKPAVILLMWLLFRYMDCKRGRRGKFSNFSISLSEKSMVSY